jgi:nitric oxide synthase-interacting protein
VFCRECALSNLLAQKKEIKRLKKLEQKSSNEAQQAKIEKEAEDHELAVNNFEKTQAGIDTFTVMASGYNKTAVKIQPSGSKRKLDAALDKDDNPIHESRTKERRLEIEERVSAST